MLNEKNISRAARRKMAQRARKTAKKRLAKRKITAKRMKNSGQLKSSAQRAAKNLLVKKMTGGKSYGSLSFGQKEMIDKKLAKKPGLINKVARKILPKVKAKEKERLKRMRSKKKKELAEVVDPATIAAVVAATGGAVAITTLLAKKLASAFSNRDVDFNVAKTYELIKRKYPIIMKMIQDQRFGQGKLANLMNDMEDAIPGLKTRTFKINATNVIDQLMKHHIWAVSGDADPKLDATRFKNESTRSTHGVLTLSVDGSQPEVSARDVNGELKPYVFKTRKDAKKWTDDVGGKPFESSETGLFYVEFTKLDGPVNEDTEYKTANEIKKHWKKEYPNDKFTFKKARAKGNEWLLVLSPKGVELERYQHVPKTGWIKMNENKDNEEDLKSLKSMLDIAQLLSSKSPYFKGRGSKKEYIKMLLHKIKKLSESREQFLEIIKVPISVGDTVLGGKFKNKKIVVKKIGKNEKGDLTLNGKPLMKVRLVKQKGQVFKEGSKEKKNQPISRQDAYKQVRKSTMPKSRPMKSKKVYDRKDYKKDTRD